MKTVDDASQANMEWSSLNVDGLAVAHWDGIALPKADDDVSAQQPPQSTSTSICVPILTNTKELEKDQELCLPQKSEA